MNARGWLVRDELRRVVQTAPAPPATWLAVVRRTVVVLAFFAAGLATNELSLFVLACFGALQVGLLEAALPWTRLVRLMAVLVAASVVAAFLAMVLGGTWASVVYVALLAYAFGSTAALSAGFASVGISALALAVIFTGFPQTPAGAVQHAGFVALGAGAQAVLALVLWAPERRNYLRRALSNKVSTDIRLLRTSAIEPTALVATHAATDTAIEALNSAGLPARGDAAMRAALSDAVYATRAILAWMLLREPGEAARLQASLALHGCVKAMGWRRAVASQPSVEGRDDPISTLAFAAIDQLHGGVVRAVAGDPGHTRELHPLLAAPPARPRVGLSVAAKALLPGGRLSRHGLRMGIALLIAESLTLVLPISHSFWLPLTVVFTLKPDWTFTLVRGLNRTLGNLAAVVLVPAIVYAIGNDAVLLAIPLCALLLVTYRWFLGHYLVASFGLAGSILLLDYVLEPDPDLFVTRIVAAFMGAVLSLAVALAIPTWRGEEGPQAVGALDEALDALRSGLDSMACDDALEVQIARVRSAIRAVEPIASGALLEPRESGNAVGLAIAVAAGTRWGQYLIALAYLDMELRDESTQQDDYEFGRQSREVQLESDWKSARNDYFARK